MTICTLLTPIGEVLRDFIGFVAVVSSGHAADVGAIVGPLSPGV